MGARVRSLTTGAAIGITLAVAAVCAAAAYLYSQRHYQALLDAARDSALARAELIRVALEHGMVRQDRSLIAPMVQAFGAEPGIAGVMLLDRTGVVRYISGPVAAGHQFDLRSPTCQACHRYPPAQRASSRVIQAGAGADILRTVVPVRNRAECHGCHTPSQKINGIVIFDVDASGLRTAASQEMRSLVAPTAVVALLIVFAIAMIVRLFVIRRWAREFNVMADSVTGLLGQVRNQRERLETVINSIDDGIVVLDRTRTVVAANDAFIRRTGGARADLLGCSCQAIEAGMCGGCDCPTLACLESGDRQVRIAQRTRADGSTAWEEIHACRIPTDSPDGVQIVEVWRDISDRRAAEARLAESHRLASLGMLASGFSHEMNTPLATVLTCVEGIAREINRHGRTIDSPRIAGHAATAREQLLRCRAITQHFLRMSRGQTSQSQILDIHKSLDEVVRLVQPTAREHDVTIDAGPFGSLPLTVRADEEDLQQAVVNLLLNAVQASAPGGRVSLQVIATAGRVTIAVQDRGCGISRDQQARIFEPFVSLRAGGTGLGLFVSLNSVRKWGGDIHVDSAPGAGATFEVILPTLDAAVARAAHA
jgi:PAS domain S-box-containing protein